MEWSRFAPFQEVCMCSVLTIVLNKSVPVYIGPNTDFISINSLELVEMVRI